jgi:hypothetical protein
MIELNYTIGAIKQLCKNIDDRNEIKPNDKVIAIYNEDGNYKTFMFKVKQLDIKFFDNDVECKPESPLSTLGVLKDNNLYDLYSAYQVIKL